MKEPNPFHVCATCIHFRAYKENGGTRYICARLGFDTRPSYRFDCWVPKEQVVKLMEKRGWKS
ncbi:hypothetical protein ABER02_20055 [Rossellomorea marisflavi]|uniref:Uncharacterized protein n=2 Tax=Rossellomorea marisflavi TaxID=189381 RepID=A0A0J5V9Z1_9BACI|nr:hypothetical protein [Rossellomorea marisflavi]KMK94089.1 hypothetical protein VL03_11735 [Rossellomorea marisflavi]KML01590.1 hypothetical protein VL06_19255 [Rossellomorea marisflavi]KZE45925.1 hypothetical protein AV649_05045 [Rossellomorea marisflavi]MCM2604952.1 hypothetical protein [Rossellomorea marisflavi]